MLCSGSDDESDANGAAAQRCHRETKPREADEVPTAQKVTTATRMATNPALKMRDGLGIDGSAIGTFQWSDGSGTGTVSGLDVG